MATEIYQRGLQIFVEANELPGADGSAVSEFTDLSGWNRHLTAGSAQPLIEAAAVNGKKSIIWDGSKNPLSNDSIFTVKAGFLVAKINGTFDAHRGLLSTLEAFGILVGDSGTDNFYDLKYDFYEYRLNDRIYSPVTAYAGGMFTQVHTPPAPVDQWAVIFFRYWKTILMDGAQLGRDRLDNTRKFKGEVALMALYNRDFCETEIRNMHLSIGYSYQIGIAEKFPFFATKGDEKTLSKRVLSDGQDEPVLRIKRTKRTFFDITASVRRQEEINRFRAFWNEFYPGKSFIFRDHDLVPPEDTVCKIPVPSEPTVAGNIPNMGFTVQCFETTEAVEYVEPATQVAIPAETNDLPPAPDTSPTITTTSLPDAFNGEAYSQTIGRTGGNSPFVWTVSDGDLPFGLSLNSSTGAITGTSSIEDSYTFTIRVTDTDGDFDEQEFTITVAPVPSLLDELSGTAQGMIEGAYSVRLLRAAYSGAALRVVNIDTSTETDVMPGFTKATIDALGAKDKMKVKIWYDQSGNGRNLDFTADGQTTKPFLEYLNRPMLDHSHVGADMYASTTAVSHFAVSNPVRFYAIDTRIGCKTISTFYDFDSTFRFRDEIAGQRLHQINGSDIAYEPQQRRGAKQLTSIFKSGDDLMRVNGAALARQSGSGTNSGDTAGGNCIFIYGDLGGNGFPFAGRCGELILADGSFPDADRDIIEASQQDYFMNGFRIIGIGDSLMNGANLTVGGNDSRDDQSVIAQVRDLYGDGADCYLLGVSGSSINNITNEANQRWLAATYLPNIIRETGNEYIVLWTGWNDVNGGETYSTLKQAFIDIVDDIKTMYPGVPIILVSMPKTLNPPNPGGAPGLSNYNTIRAAINADMLTGYNTIFGADAYANIASDPDIGDGGDPSDPTYWNDAPFGLHMTAAGYAIVATYIKDAIDSIL